MFERFSSGYYLGRLYVEPTDGPHATISQRTYESVTEDLYGEQQPLVVKLGQTHLAVRGEAGVPARTLSVPATGLDAVGRPTGEGRRGIAVSPGGDGAAGDIAVRER
jgi:hypothetical protein